MDTDAKTKIVEFGSLFTDTHLTPANWCDQLLEAAADLDTVTEAWVQTEFQKRGWMHITAVGVLVPWGGDCRNFKPDPDEYSD